MKDNKKMPVVKVVYDFRGETINKETGRMTGLPGTVSVRVYKNRKYQMISTGVRVMPAEWSDGYYVIGRSDAAVLNGMIREQVERCRAQIVEANEVGGVLPTTSVMKVDRSDASFLEWLHAAIKDDDAIGDDTRKHHVATYNMLCEWGKMLRFEHVTEKNVRAWLRWIANRSVMKPGLDGKMHATKICQATVHDHWKRLRKYLRIAAKEKRIARVYEDISVSRGDDPVREYLTDEEIEAWLSTKMNLPSLEMARLRFIVQMGCGMAYKDMMTKDFSRAQNINGQWCLQERREKTKVGFFTILLPWAVEVLESWNWQIPPISNVDYNKFLDRVAVVCGINKHITSHTARHTYACYCLRHGVRIEAVQRTLGHKDIKTTQIYARMADMDVVNEFAKLE